jgi:hypothetical protein
MKARIQTLSSDLVQTKKEISMFDTRFNTIESQQRNQTEMQQARFDRLEALLLRSVNAGSPFSPQLTMDPMRATLNPSPLSHSTGLSPMFSTSDNWHDNMDASNDT